MDGGQQVIEAFRRSGIVEPHRNDVDPELQCPLHFANDVRRNVGVLTIYKDKTAGGLDRGQDCLGVGTAGRHVPRCNPAVDPALLKRSHDSVGRVGILMGMTDENAFVAHSLTLQS